MKINLEKNKRVNKYNNVWREIKDERRKILKIKIKRLERIKKNW